MVYKIATLTKKLYSTMMNAKDTLKQVRVILGFDQEEKTTEFAKAMLTDGTTISWEGDLAVGTAIFVETAEGLIPAPDATHEVEDGTLVTTLGGVVTEIVSPETEVPPVEINVEAEEFATISRFNEVVESLESKISDLNKAIESLIVERASHKEAMSKVVDLCEKMIDLPSVEPTKKPHTPTKQETQFENLKKFANSLKK